MTVTPKIEIELDENRADFACGETLRGRVGWTLAAPPASVEIRLKWTTSGRGTTDGCTVQTLAIKFGGSQSPFARDLNEQLPIASAPFEFIVPAEPHSFAGTLVALSWSLEAVAWPQGLWAPVKASAAITVSASGAGALQLPRVSVPEDHFERLRDEWRAARTR